MALIVGATIGALSYHAILSIGDSAVVPLLTFDEQLARIAALEEENRQLSEDLFARTTPAPPRFDDSDLPYDENANAHEKVNVARATATRDQKILMVTFGANWCVDCRTLYNHLKSDDVALYTKDRFMFVNVDVGMFDRNRAVATELGVSLQRGIPVAIFFDVKGRKIGATNDGELEPARYYTSEQILKFVRDVAERSRILAPDAVQ